MALAILSVFLLFAISTQALFPHLGPIVDPMPPLPAYTSYIKTPVCIPSDQIRTPQSASDVVAIVKEAISRNTTVKAFGHRHSITDIICTDGIPVDMRGVKGITLNADMTATVGAGMNLHDTTEFLRQNGRSLKTTPAFGNITIGGAIGTGAHGSSIKYTASISSQVVGVTIVDGLGNIQTLTAEEDLRAFRLHLGLLGILVNVTLSTQPLYKVRAHNYLVSDEVITNGTIIDIARNTDQVTAYWFPSFKLVLIANWTIVDVNTPGNAVTNDHVPPTSETFNAYVTPLAEVIQSLKAADGLNVLQGYTMQSMLTTIPDFVPIYTENGLTVQNPAVGYYDLMFAPICQESGFLQCPWDHGFNGLRFLDNEISLPLDSLPAFGRTLQDIASKTPAVFPFDGILLRFSANSTTYMSTSQGRDTAHFEFYMINRRDSYNDPSAGLPAYQTILQALVGQYSGRSHWGKTGMHYHSKEVLDSKLDPAARASFISKMSQYDPNGVFLNDFGKRLMGIGTEMDLDPATIHCALLDYCICSKNSDCANGQFCTTIQGYSNYPVCSDIPIVPPPLPIVLDQNAYKINTNLTIDGLFCSLNLPSLAGNINCTTLSLPLPGLG